MLRASGFDSAAVEDGGLKKWCAEGRPVGEGAPKVTPSRFTVDPRPRLFTTKKGALEAAESGAACLVNVLAAEDFHATRTPRHARARRIPGSLNVSAVDLVDPETGEHLPNLGLAGALRRRVGAPRAECAYCGGGMAASGDALALTVLGEDDVAVYDGSLAEWTAGPSLPPETG